MKLNRILVTVALLVLAGFAVLGSRASMLAGTRSSRRDGIGETALVLSKESPRRLKLNPRSVGRSGASYCRRRSTD